MNFWNTWLKFFFIIIIIMKSKMKIYLITSESNNWLQFYKDIIELVTDVKEADFVLYEKYAYPIKEINHLKATYPKNKLVFILSSPKNDYLDDECIWFTNAINGALKKRQTQIPCNNPCVFRYKYTNPVKTGDVYFKGTVWKFREPMFKYFSQKPNCNMQRFDDYWKIRADESEPEEFIAKSAIAMYDEMSKYKLSLCPRGWGLSSMRIVESLRCKCIPVLIDDFTAPYGIDWKTVGLVFDTSRQSWDQMYAEISALLLDERRMNKLRKEGQRIFNDILAADLKKGPCNTFKTVAWGSSQMVVNKLDEYLE